MSEYRVCKVTIGQQKNIDNKKFDNKEDAEHYAKNQSASDDTHGYNVQKNHQGDFVTIKSYMKGNVV